MSEIKELKVGDVVSNNDGFGWTSRLLKTKSDLWAFLSNVVEVGDDWQHGLHSSLIPEGFALIEQCTIDTTNELNGAYMHGMGRMYDELEAFRDIVAQQASQLIAAQKEKGQLHDLLNAAHTEISRLKTAPKPTDK